MEQGNSLWLLFLEGDKHAFSALFKHYYPNLHSYGLKICGNVETTEDCIQNLFVLLFEKRKDLGHIKNPNAYLFVSLRNAILKEQKKHNSSVQFSTTTETEDSFLFSPEDFVINNESMAKSSATLSLMVNKLSNRQREVVYLKYYSELTNIEISQVMDISVQSVANMVMKAMAKLRDDRLKSVLQKVLSR